MYLVGETAVVSILVASLISNVIGMKLPGEGSIYMEQNLKFVRPVFIGDTVTARVEIMEVISKNKNVLRLDTKVMNQNNEIVIDGSAVVKAPERIGE